MFFQNHFSLIFNAVKNWGSRNVFYEEFVCTYLYAKKRNSFFLQWQYFWCRLIIAFWIPFAHTCDYVGEWYRIKDAYKSFSEVAGQYKLSAIRIKLFSLKYFFWNFFDSTDSSISFFYWFRSFQLDFLSILFQIWYKLFCWRIKCLSSVEAVQKIFE